MEQAFWCLEGESQLWLKLNKEHTTLCKGNIRLGVDVNTVNFERVKLLLIYGMNREERSTEIDDEGCRKTGVFDVPAERSAVCSCPS